MYAARVNGYHHSNKDSGRYDKSFVYPKRYCYAGGEARQLEAAIRGQSEIIKSEAAKRSRYTLVLMVCLDSFSILSLVFSIFRDVMNILIANNKENLFQKVVFKNIEKLHLSGEMLWAVQYYAGGTLSLILEWIKNPTEGYKQELINGILKMTRKSVLDEAVKSYQKNLDQIK